MEFKKMATAVVVCTAAMFTGCASIVSDSKYPVAINSTPSGANFVITNKAGVEVHSGQTPSTVTLKAGEGFFSGETYQVRMTLDNHEEKIITIDTSIDGWYVGNILFGGLIGLLIVDPMTGAMWKLPDNSQADLVERLVVDNNAEPSLTIATTDALSEEEKKDLVPVTQ